MDSPKFVEKLHSYKRVRAMEKCCLDIGFWSPLCPEFRVYYGISRNFRSSATFLLTIDCISESKIISSHQRRWWEGLLLKPHQRIG